jgi:hypothetical protein
VADLVVLLTRLAVMVAQVAELVETLATLELVAQAFQDKALQVELLVEAL